MAAQFKHKRYFQLMGPDSSPVTFSSTSDAESKIGFNAVWNTSSPTKTFALEDSDTTLVVTYEFNSEAEQTAFKSAVDTAWGDGTVMFDHYIGQETSGATVGNRNPSDVDYDDAKWHHVYLIKTEWLYADGSVSATANFE